MPSLLCYCWLWVVRVLFQTAILVRYLVNVLIGTQKGVITMLTTGQIAKRCQISVRTVQFYDRKDILKPSNITEGGRRLYTENDLVKLKMICLYKGLGFSLYEVKLILNESKNEEIRNILKEKRRALAVDIEQLKTNEKYLRLLEELIMDDHLSVENVDKLDDILIKQNHFKKTNRAMYVMVASYVAILLLIIYLAKPIDGIKPYVIMLVGMIFLFGLVYFHASSTAYQCPKCRKKFTLGFIKDLLTIHDNKKGAKTTCPYCKRKGWFKETYKE